LKSDGLECGFLDWCLTTSISYQEEELMNTESCIPSSYEIFYDFLVLIGYSGLIITQVFGDNAFCNIDENLKI